NSLLFLKYMGLHEAATQRRIRAHFTAGGIDARRVLFEGYTSHAELLDQYNHIDLGLDTQPYSGGVTTCEALLMGEPVISLPGKTFAGRHATSHLMNSGHPQFVAQDLAGYVELAVEWANRLNDLADIRARMRENVLRSPLCDARRFARDFLDIVEQAWKS